MWSIILTLLISVAAISSETLDDCNKHSYNICGVDAIPDGFPGTREELYHTCKLEIQFLKCVIQNEEKCQTDPEFIDKHRNQLAASRRLCDRESLLHYLVVSNLACVKPIFDDNAAECYAAYPGHSSMKKHAQAFRREKIQVFNKTNSKEDRVNCLKRLFMLTCEALKIEEKCGNSAMEAFIDVIYARSLPQSEYCNRKIKKYPLDIVYTMKMEELRDLEKNEIDENEPTQFVFE